MDIRVAIVIVVLVLAMAFMVWLYFRDAEKKRIHEYREKALAEILPNRLQAYERMSLYISRIDPEEMALREQSSAATAKDLYIAMMNSIRQEFEHNNAMQIYISTASWKLILKAKEEVSKTLKDTLKTLNPNATPIELAAEFIEAARNTCKFYVDRAQEGLRKDLSGHAFNE